MEKFRYFGSVLGCLVLGACTSINPSDKASVIYNKAFAKARDEVALQNILRASQSQGLQFSTISSVAGSVKYGASIQVPFTNIIAGGEDSISPTVTLNNRNPSVTIIPLATTEFVKGVSTPLPPITPVHLINQGWSAQVVLQLTVGGITCGTGNDRRTYFNTGDRDTSDDNNDEDFIAALKKASITVVQENEEEFDFSLPLKDGIMALQNGAGEGRKLALTTSPIRPSETNMIALRLTKPKPDRLTSPAFKDFCETKYPDMLSPAQKNDMTLSERLDQERRTNKRNSFISASSPSIEENSSKTDEPRLVMRSVKGIYRYLGNLHRANLKKMNGQCENNDVINQAFLRILWSCDSRVTASPILVETEFYRKTYFVPFKEITETAKRNSADKIDQTPEIIALLTYLLDLQTNDALLKGSAPILTISQ